MLTTLYIACATLVGVVLGWILGSRRGESAAGMEAELRRQIANRETGLAEARSRENLLLSEKATAAAERDAVREVLTQLQSVQDKSLAQMRESFQALSAEALKENNPAFLHMARQ